MATTYQASPIWIQILSLVAHAAVVALCLAVFADLQQRTFYGGIPGVQYDFGTMPSVKGILSGQILLLYSYFLISSVIAFVMEIPGLKSLQELMARFALQWSTILGRGIADIFFGWAIIICMSGYLHGIDNLNSRDMAIYDYAVATTVIGVVVVLVGSVKVILGFFTPEAPESEHKVEA